MEGSLAITRAITRAPLHTVVGTFGVVQHRKFSDAEEAGVDWQVWYFIAVGGKQSQAWVPHSQSQPIQDSIHKGVIVLDNTDHAMKS